VTSYLTSDQLSTSCSGGAELDLFLPSIYHQIPLERRFMLPCCSTISSQLCHPEEGRRESRWPGRKETLPERVPLKSQMELSSTPQDTSCCTYIQQLFANSLFRTTSWLAVVSPLSDMYAVQR
jgi:hypothetical protein